MAENFSTVRKRLIKHLKRHVRDCGDMIEFADCLARFKPGLAPVDVETYRVRGAGAIRALECVLAGKQIDAIAQRLLTPEPGWNELFKFLCNTCHEPMLYVDKYMVCPNGHGRLIPIERAFRKGPEYRKRRIGQGRLNRFLRGEAPPPETKLCTCGERIAAEEERCGLCHRTAELNSAKEGRSN